MITFLPLGQNDLELVRTWRNQEEIRNKMYTNHIISPEEHLAWYKRISADPGVRYWIFSADGVKKAGLVNLYNLDLRNKQAFWGLYIGDRGMKGKGIGLKVEFALLDYVFFDLNLNKLNCEALSFNKPAIQFYKKFGLEEEGYFKQHVFRDNQYYDVVRLAILKDDWVNLHRERIKKSMGITEEEIARKKIYI